jgi:eukaryotic-like serine/threonine-protein kinase
MANADAADRNAGTGEGARGAPAAAPAYFAFISYSHQDELWATWLHKSLETWHVPSRLVGQTTAAGTVPRRLLPIFRDRDELASATDLGRKVNEALAQSANLIVICSPNSARSRWVNEEVLAYKRLGNAERIFCLIVGGEPNASEMPGREAEECFAPALRFQLDADGQLTSERTEPIAADAREGKDGRANAKLKLIAGMLDVGFDALKQRELQRRNRRMAAVTAAALIVMAITTTLAITAVIARHDAERRQKQAEDLVGFMLGDLNDRLREVQRLDIMQAVDDQAMTYFESLPVKDETDAVLRQRVIALEKIGSIRMERGRLPQALQSYESAAALAAELFRRRPDDASRKADYADSLKWIGQVYWYRGDLERASANFQHAAILLQEANAGKSDSNLAFKLAAVLNNIGHVAEARGDLVDAKRRYEAMKAVFVSLAGREPDNPRWQTYLGDADNNLGKVALRQGDIAGAIGSYLADERTKSALFRRESKNHDVEEALLVSDAILGRTLALCGNRDAAMRYTSQAVAHARSLASFDASNVGWQELLGLYSQQLGRMLRQGAQMKDAGVADVEAIGILQKLVTASPANADFRAELAQAQLEHARLLIDQNEIAQAEASIRGAIEDLERLDAGNGASRDVRLALAEASLLSANVAEQHGAAEQARQLRIEARDRALSLGAGVGDPRILAVAAGAMVALGQKDPAAPLLERLSAMGYADADFMASMKNHEMPYQPNAAALARIVRTIQ